VARQVEREFAGDSGSPADARTFATDALPRLLARGVPSMLCDDVVLVVSELVTNAVRAGASTVRVGLEDTGATVVVRVNDDAEGWPEPRSAGIHDVGGRGLPLVSALSETWGVRLADAGKLVWAAITIPQD
jgi:anti-sigma regulatory factor (Ser/Thr protein kinase)